MYFVPECVIHPERKTSSNRPSVILRGTPYGAAEAGIDMRYTSDDIRQIRRDNRDLLILAEQIRSQIQPFYVNGKTAKGNLKCGSLKELKICHG